MKIVRMVMAVLLLAVPVAGWGAELGIVRLSLVDGDVQVQAQDADEWVPAVANMPLAEGDRIWVPEGGRTELQIRGGCYLRLDAGSSLDIVAARNESLQFYLAEGRAYINNRKGGTKRIQMDAPDASTVIADNSIVMVDADYDGNIGVPVIRGHVLVDTERGTVRVPAGRSLRIDYEGGTELAPLDPPDEWLAWNRNQDRRLETAAESLRYVPVELEDYAYDLDDYGRWHYLPEYGYVWAPRLSLSAGWSPYRQGRWVWVRGDYVWISYEPWGWAPYHYGRWTHTPRFGWCWVPPARGAAWWGPGYVGWVHTPESVAWVPLAPGDIYYGYGNFGPNSVNIVNATVSRSAVRHYRNIRVRNAVTVIHSDTFIKGKQQRVAVRGNLFTARVGSVGPPRFRPERETRRPVFKSVPAVKRPPERLSRPKRHDAPEQRRHAPDGKGAVILPGRPAGELPVVRREAPKQPAVKPAAPAMKNRDIRGGKPLAPAVRYRESQGVAVKGDRGDEQVKRRSRPRDGRTMTPPLSPSPATALPAAHDNPQPAVTAPPNPQPKRSRPPRQRPAAVIQQTGSAEGRPPGQGGEKREKGEHGITAAPASPSVKQPANTPQGEERKEHKGREEWKKEGAR
ncbi:FecR family protein [Geobacter benzoatilyticus]|uniref:FecR domain-containing protein n=1 Tax=Geobacter benzoatilyticus TaxID=2815309 RepID=A0ABX7Q356_9BACT|nr:FecR family protein [Geobacter benzoatilyticus]QSV45883.1 FecR domain-containing protein [Geobacter benzoatilyticus]